MQGHNYGDVDDHLDVGNEKAVYERKETILEIRDTEINYGRDLKILKEVRNGKMDWFIGVLRHMQQ